MKCLVTYKSKTGFSKKYANWISEELNADLFKIDDIKIDRMLEYDVIIHCGGIYVGGILGSNYIKKNLDKLKDKKVIFVAVGATIKCNEAHEEILNRNFKKEIQDKIKLYLVRGGLDYKNMTKLDRFLMFLLVKSIKAKKENNDEEAKALVATYGKTVDFTNKNSIKSIIEEVKSSNDF